MFSKHPLPNLDEVPADARLRHNLVDLFLASDVSGARAASLFQDAVAAGASNVSDLGKVTSRKHACRDILRKVLKRTQWPKLYYASITVWDKDKQEETKAMLPFLLPHEVVAALAKRGSRDNLLCKEGMSTEAKAHLEAVSEELGLTEALGLGVWLDGVPCNWDRSQSLECVALSFPGWVGQHANIRFPITVIQKRHCVKHKTLDEILSIISWSLTCLAEGCMPVARHDNTPWLPGDHLRKKQAAQSTGLHGILAEVRGDWSCFKSVFRLPSWNERGGCCWRCRATPATIKETGLDASWRLPENRLDHWKLMHRMLSQGLTLSPLFSAPGFKSSCFQLDWLHCADLGITADLLGQLFWLLLDKLPGHDREARCQQLYLRMVAWYKANKTDSRLDNLTVSMLKKEASRSPKLRAKAAEARALVPFAHETALELLSADHPLESTAIQCITHLAQCYRCLSVPLFNPAVLEEHSRKLCLLWVALEEYTADDSWRIKPKLHLFQELCESGSCPSTCWTYRDEDFGGTLARLSRRRGGHNTPRGLAQSVLLRFLGLHSVPIV